jgi:hypothetical protein
MRAPWSQASKSFVPFVCAVTHAGGFRSAQMIVCHETSISYDESRRQFLDERQKIRRSRDFHDECFARRWIQLDESDRRRRGAQSV